MKLKWEDKPLSAGRVQLPEDLKKICPQCKRALPPEYEWIFCPDCRPWALRIWTMNGIRLPITREGYDDETANKFIALLADKQRGDA